MGRALGISLIIAAAMAVALVSGSAASASTGGPLVLHPNFTRVAGAPRRGSCIAIDLPATSGQYALTYTSNKCVAALFNDKSHSRTSLGLSDVLAFGAPWIFVDTAKHRSSLYNVVTKTWRRFRCGSDCVRSAPDGRPGYSLGAQWLEASGQVCGESAEGRTCGPVTRRFYNLETGAIRKHVALDSTHILDLNSPTLTRRVCAPLRVPSGGSLALRGQFAVASQPGGEVFLERCGSKLHMQIDPFSSTPADRGSWVANDHTVMWTVQSADGTWHGQFEGVFLPSLRRFTFTVPYKHQYESGALLDSSRGYFMDDYGAVWAASVTPPHARTQQTPDGPLHSVGG